jgi:DNA polymerase III epsilon subunit-like protein
MRTICFDTETTGLPESKHASIYDTDKWPHVIQLSFIVYDDSKGASEIVEEYDEIIKIDESVNLTAKSIEIHGISREMSSERGIPIADALCAFKRALKSCDCCVGHNISFDKRILIVEAIRNKGFDPDDSSYVQLPFKNEFCTMLKSVDICKIELYWNCITTYFILPPKMLTILKLTF